LPGGLYFKVVSVESGFVESEPSEMVSKRIK